MEFKYYIKPRNVYEQAERDNLIMLIVVWSFLLSIIIVSGCSKVSQATADKTYIKGDCKCC